MTFRWVLTALFALSFWAEIMLMGRPRKPITANDVSAQMVLSGVLIYGIWNWI